jgi:hypothetical protein
MFGSRGALPGWIVSLARSECFVRCGDDLLNPFSLCACMKFIADAIVETVPHLQPHLSGGGGDPS